MTIPARWLSVVFGLLLLALGTTLTADALGVAAGAVGLVALGMLAVRPALVSPRGIVCVLFLGQLTIVRNPPIVLVAVGVLLLSGFLAASDGAAMGATTGIEAVTSQRAPLVSAAVAAAVVIACTQFRTHDRLVVDALLAAGAAAAVLALLLCLRAVRD